MPIEQRLTLPLLQELTLAALDDAVDDVALNHPGVAAPLRGGHSQRERRGDVQRRLEQLRTDPQFPQLATLEGHWQTIDRLSLVGDFQRLWSAFVATLDTLEAASPHSGPAPTPIFEFVNLDEDRAIGLRLSTQLLSDPALRDLSLTDDAAGFVAAVTAMCGHYRGTNTLRFAPADRLALLRAYQLVESGVRPAPAMSPLQTGLSRPFPTYLALADPGRSHLRHTVRRSDLLRGTVVHVETIDRGGIPNRGQVEAYRIPSIRDVARIRVHVGAETPCSVYVGRPVHEGWSKEDPKNRKKENTKREKDTESGERFDQSLLKAIHTVGAACSGLFSLGVAECKIGLDGLTSSQAIKTMKSLVGNVIRDRTRQRLSAAFNINTPLADDRDGSRSPVVITDPLQVARLAIDLAHLGHFDKVTWDGASDGPSQPFVEQLAAPRLLELVHRAHELGLETYFSAGMTAQHLLPATELGVGGVGIGIRLHATNPANAIAHLLPDDILKVLATRNAAMKGIAGRAAAALAQLDWMSARGPLDAQPEALRQQLFQTLLRYHETANPSDRLLLEEPLQTLVPTVEQYLSQQKQQSTQPTRGGPAGTPDPIFEIAEGELRRAQRESQRDDARRLRSMIDDGDDEGLKYFLGYR
jgi:hypothetical protein